MSDFPEFTKIPRLYKPVVITEKIDGTNGLIEIVHDGAGLAPDAEPEQYHGYTVLDHEGEQYSIRAGSRKRWITPEQDNYGFAAWVRENAQRLVKLGPGTHYGEWFGLGINRGYGLTEKRFALFNAGRWFDPYSDYPESESTATEECPECCTVVPVLVSTTGEKLQQAIDCSSEELRENGSAMVEGYYKPEGLIVWHDAARQYFKVVFEGDNKPKSLL